MCSEKIKLHTQLGHPSLDRLAAELLDLRMTSELVACTRLFCLSFCLQRRRPQLFRPTSLQLPHHFNYTIATGCFKVVWKTVKTYKARITTVVDEFSRYEVDEQLAKETIQIPSKLLKNHGYVLEVGHVRTPHVEYSERDALAIFCQAGHHSKSVSPRPGQH